MKNTSLAVFRQYQRDLGNEPGLWAARLFDASNCGGMVWRNAAHCEAGAKMGFFPSPTIPWSGVVSYFQPEHLAQLESCYRDAFATDEPILRQIVFQNEQTICHEDIWLCAAYGNMAHGVIVTLTFERSVAPLPPA